MLQTEEAQEQRRVRTRRRSALRPLPTHLRLQRPAPSVQAMRRPGCGGLPVAFSNPIPLLTRTLAHATVAACIAPHHPSSRAAHIHMCAFTGAHIHIQRMRM